MVEIDKKLRDVFIVPRQHGDTIHPNSFLNTIPEIKYKIGVKHTQSDAAELLWRLMKCK